MITHRLRLSGLVGAVIAWLLLFLCEFICAQTLPNDEPDAYKPSASTDPKKITISDERVLPEIRKRTGTSGRFAEAQAC